jgi:hypothetical protein
MAGGIINTGAHPKTLWPGIHSLFGMWYQNRDLWRDLVTVQTSDKHREEIVQEDGFGLAAIKEQGGSIGYDTTSQQGTATAYHIVYGLGYIITREAIEDNQYEKLASARAKALKRAMVETKNTVRTGSIAALTPTTPLVRRPNRCSRRRTGPRWAARATSWPPPPTCLKLRWKTCAFRLPAPPMAVATRCRCKFAACTSRVN